MKVPDLRTIAPRRIAAAAALIVLTSGCAGTRRLEPAIGATFHDHDLPTQAVVGFAAHFLFHPPAQSGSAFGVLVDAAFLTDDFRFTAAPIYSYDVTTPRWELSPYAGPAVVVRRADFVLGLIDTGKDIPALTLAGRAGLRFRYRLGDNLRLLVDVLNVEVEYSADDGGPLYSYFPVIGLAWDKWLAP